MHAVYFQTDFPDYDVALLTLSSPLIFGKCVSPICLPTASADPTATDFCQTAGWGALLCKYFLFQYFY